MTDDPKSARTTKSDTFATQVRRLANARKIAEWAALRMVAARAANYHEPIEQALEALLEREGRAKK